MFATITGVFSTLRKPIKFSHSKSTFFVYTSGKSFYLAFMLIADVLTSRQCRFMFVLPGGDFAIPCFLHCCEIVMYANHLLAALSFFNDGSAFQTTVV